MNYMHGEGMAYIIKQGDTLYSISRRYNIPLAMLLQANPYADMYNLQIGDEICIPIMGLPQNENKGMKSNMSGNMESNMESSMDRNMDRNMDNNMNRNMNGNMNNPNTTNNNMMAYVVKDMESLENLTNRFNMDLEELLYYNNLNEIILKPGTTIKIPMNNIK